MKINRNKGEAQVIRRRAGGQVLETWIGPVHEAPKSYIEKLRTEISCLG